MSSKHNKLTPSNDASMNTIVLTSDSSLIDLLNQQTTETPKLDFEYDKSSTLFNTTGRERNSTGPLKQWLYEHRDNPYPKESDRQELMKQTNMSAAQITIWFTNARVKMRKEKKLSIKSQDKKKKQKSIDPFDELFSIIDDLFPCTTPSPPSKQFVIAYSCLNGEQATSLHDLASLFSDQICIAECVDEHTTHLIIGKEEKSLLCPLTTKLFQSIARHLFIVSPRWINDCLQEKTILDEMNYEIRGDIPYGGYHDGMRKSRLSKQVNLFDKCQFFILCDDCQNDMSKDELMALIQLCHGSFLKTFPLTATTEMDSTILTIVLCNELLPFDNANQQQLFDLARDNGVFFLNPGWVLESILQFSLQPFELYEETF